MRGACWLVVFGDSIQDITPDRGMAPETHTRRGLFPCPHSFQLPASARKWRFETAPARDQVGLIAPAEELRPTIPHD